MGSQASRETCEGDIRLQVTRLLSPICSGSPRREVGERFLRTVSASAFLLNMTVMSSSGVIVSPSDVPVRQIQPLTTVVSTQ